MFSKHTRPLFLLLFAAAVAPASPITYDINFTTLTAGPPPTSGSFTYDAGAATDPFSNFIVVWNGITYDLTSAANAGGQGAGISCPSPSTQAVFTFLSGTTTCSSGTGDIITWAVRDQAVGYAFQFADGNTGFFDYLLVQDLVDGPINGPGPTGTFTISAVQSTPEPGTLLTMALGALLFLKRRR